MKLRKVHVTEFQSVRDSNIFEVGDITCLVGKNEAGKTTLLQALYRLNPIINTEGKFDVTDDYPRSDVEDYQKDVESGKRKPAKVIIATFTLDNNELEDLQNDYGKDILNKNELTLSKGYDNQLYISLAINEKKAIENFIESAQLPSELSDGLKKCNVYEDFVKKIEILENAETNEHLKRIRTIIASVQKAEGLILYFYNLYIKKSVPKFMYFDEYYLMKGHENIESLISRNQQNKLEKSDHPLLGLIKIARIELNELINPNRTQWLMNKLEGASNYLSKSILKYWSQNKHLEMRFDVRPGRPGDPPGMTTGNNIWASVYDRKHKVTTLLGTRSRGFVWFFSFLAWFNQQQRKEESLILLLDEPGLFLHGKAQGDFLNFIENELQPNHQIIYTTHSPFMVNPKNFDSVRIVQDRGMEKDEFSSDEEGTKVFTDVLEATEDSLFPLQGALGYEISQTLFVGPNCLIVEGVSDLLYLQTVSGILDSLNRISLDKKWTITPVGGSDKVLTFVALLGSQKGLNLATLIDIQKKDKQNIENLYKRKLLKKKNVLTFGDFTNSQESDLEDMFKPSFYLLLLNGEYGSQMKSNVSEKDIQNNDTRILKRLEKYFDNNPLKDGKTFSHYRPARYFAENIQSLKTSIPDETLQRFESAFKVINNLV